MVPELKNLTYEEIFKEMQLSTFEERRAGGDPITISTAGHKLWTKVQKELKDKRKTWKTEQKKEQESLRKIVEDYEFEKKNLAKKVFIVIKQKDNLVRDSVDKKICDNFCTKKNI